MNLEQKVASLRKRIQDLRATLEVNNTSDESTPSVEQPKPSAADEYKARLMGKRSS
jgi:hypothetical protein